MTRCKERLGPISRLLACLGRRAMFLRCHILPCCDRERLSPFARCLYSLSSCTAYLRCLVWEGGSSLFNSVLRGHSRDFFLQYIKTLRGSFEVSCSERELWSFLPFCTDRSSSLVMYARLILRQIQAFPQKKNRGNVRACMQAVIDRSGGGVLLAASEYFTAKLWCPESDECIRTLEGH